MVVDRVWRILEEWQSNRTDTTLAIPKRREEWQPREVGSTKGNENGATDNLMAVRWSSEITMACSFARASHFSQSIGAPDLVELLACRQVVQMTLELARGCKCWHSETYWQGAMVVKGHLPLMKILVLMPL